MTKFLDDDALDATLDEIASATRFDACSAAPTTYAEATSTYTLGTASMVGGDYTIEDNPEGTGRRLTIDHPENVTATGSGTPTHVALTDGSSRLIHVTEIDNPDAVSSGDTLHFTDEKVYQPDPT